MRDPDRLATYLLELLAPFGAMSARRLFGGTGLFHKDMMFGLSVREELYLKVGDSNRRAYEEAGEAPFSYETKNGVRTIQSYWRCPPELLDDADRFREWVRAAIEAAILGSHTKPKLAVKPRSRKRARIVAP